MKILLSSILFLSLVSISVSTPAVTHLHSVRNSGEREEDGAYSPRNRKHQSGGEHHSEFDHEAILGSVKDAEEFDHLSEAESKRRLAILLKKMDLNQDNSISRKELHSWIMRSFRMLSEEESQDRFEDSDENEDGKVTWQEYLTDTFGISDNNIESHDEKLIHDDKAMFDFADKNKDGALDKREFLLFSHPEEHAEMFPLIVQQTLEEKDTNKDGFLDFQEFIGNKGKEQDKEWLISEKTKFDTDYDKDKDGRLNSNEILSWMVPSNDEIIEEEVEHLFTECDNNGDDALSFDEVLEHYDVFVGSEATDYGDHLHNIHSFQDEL
ncbi:hypothetical protein RUM44_003311 [Polyplax serrata]|uniref:EF-hand domain-containing protein n=1 Tax=Polyplax serrata TaxID=468196 RepID=A0ABR1AG28_POLSC